MPLLDTRERIERDKGETRERLARDKRETSKRQEKAEHICLFQY